MLMFTFKHNMAGFSQQLIYALLFLSLGCALDPIQNSDDSFNKGLQELIEEIQRSHPDLDFSHQEKNINGSLFKSFPCKRLAPSPSPPTSVHKLRPGDINVVAALGDSLTAAKAAGSEGLSSLLHDYRGLSWSIGGDGTFQTLHSLPNILKEYNPDIYGFSNSIGNYMSLEAGFNVAKSGATSNDLAFQAALLVQKLKNDPRIDFQNDWKLITIFIGGNDICRSCYSFYNSRFYLKHLKSTLDMLKTLVPKAFVNLVEIMPVELVRKLPKGFVCEKIQNLYCQCAVFPKTEDDYNQLIVERKEFQKFTEDLISSGIYDTSDDFTVILQPFYRNASVPKIPGTDKIDYSLFAVDCFHYSIKGQSKTGLALWNNMLQPINNKTTDWKATDKILCPTDSHPFLATRKNSEILGHGGDLESYDYRQENTPSNSNTEEFIDEIVANNIKDSTSNILMMKELKSNIKTSKPSKEEDTEHLRQGLTIMIIGTIAVLLLMILAGVLYYGMGLLRYNAGHGSYQKI